MMRTVKIVAVSLVLLWNAAHADQHAAYFAEPRAQETEGFRDVFAQIAPRVYIAGQPSEDGFARAKAMGVTRVINLRTEMEMNDRNIVPFDEAALLGELGIDYVHIPSGGPDTPYSPAALDKFVQSLDDAEGAVLLHCTVAWRATHLWTAYLIQQQGLSFNEAVDVGRRLNFGNLPLEGFLDQPLTVGPRDE